VSYSALRSDDGAFSYLAVSDYSDLTSQNYSPADFRRTSEADLRAEQGVFADLRSVADLYEIVDLDSATDASFADAGAVDAGVGLNLYVVFDDDRGRLRNLVPMSIVSLGETEAVGTDHDAILQQHVVADLAVLADHGVCVGEEVVANLNPAIDDDVRQQHGVVADLDVFVDDDIRANVRAATNLRCGVDDGRGMHSRGIAQRLVKEFEGVCEAEIGILDAQRGCGDGGKVFGNNHSCGLGKPGCGGVLGVGDESEFSGAGLLDAVEAGDVDVRRTVFEARVESGSDGREFHGGCLVRRE